MVAELIEMVSGGNLDLAVCFSLTQRSDLQSESLGPQRYHVVARTGHPLAQPGKGSMEALSRAQWLLPAPSVGMRVEDAFARQGLCARDGRPDGLIHCAVRKPDSGVGPPDRLDDTDAALTRWARIG